MAFFFPLTLEEVEVRNEAIEESGSAGFVVSELGELPTVGASVEVDGHRLTVTELDGRRVARISVTAVSDGPGTEGDGESLSE